MRCLQLTQEEQACLATLTGTAGFAFTKKVQRSWCAGRAAKAAHLTLSVLSEEVRERLLDEWTESGEGTLSFVGAEAAAFLDFIAIHLCEPSHELTICQLERATLRASEGADTFSAPDWSPEKVLRTSRYAARVRFYADPNHLFRALLNKEPLPPLSDKGITLIFGPGFERMHNRASADEAALYDRLKFPATSIDLLRESYKSETIQALLQTGVIEYA